jgi:hypothetical protein
MRYLRHSPISLIFLCLAFVAFTSAQKKSLAEIYKTGKVSFIPEITIDDSALPEGVFLEGYGDVAVDGVGCVYFLDRRAKHIKKFDLTGKFIKLIGREGQGPGEFSSPYRLACSGDSLVVWDMMGFRFSLFTLEGDPIKSVRHSFLEEGNPMKIRALPSGEFVVGLEKIYRDPKKPQDYLIQLYSSEMEVQKTIYTHSVWRNIWGIPNAPNIPVPFSPQVYWDLTPDGEIVIGFSEKYEIDVYDKEKGKIASFARNYDPIEVTKEDKTTFFSNLIFAGSTSDGAVVQREPPPALKENVKFPEFKPAFNSIAVDSDGNVLIGPYVKDKKEEYRYFDAFDSQGNFIARVRIESEHSFYGLSRAQIIDGYFWGGETDKDGYIKIVKYRIAEASDNK